MKRLALIAAALPTNPDGTIGFDGTVKFRGGTGAYT